MDCQPQIAGHSTGNQPCIFSVLKFFISQQLWADPDNVPFISHALFSVQFFHSVISVHFFCAVYFCASDEKCTYLTSRPIV